MLADASVWARLSNASRARGSADPLSWARAICELCLSALAKVVAVDVSIMVMRLADMIASCANIPTLIVFVLCLCRL